MFEFLLKIYAFSPLPVMWGAWWTLVFPPDPDISALVLWGSRGNTIRSLLLLLFSVWDSELVTSQMFLESQMLAWENCLSLPLENNPHLEDQVLNKLMHTQKLLGGPFPFVLVWGAEFWTQGPMHAEQTLWQCYIPQFFTFEQECPCNLPKCLGIKFFKERRLNIYTYMKYINTLYITYMHVFTNMFIHTNIHLSVCLWVCIFLYVCSCTGPIHEKWHFPYIIIQHHLLCIADCVLYFTFWSLKSFHLLSYFENWKGWNISNTT